MERIRNDVRRGKVDILRPWGHTYSKNGKFNAGRKERDGRNFEKGRCKLEESKGPGTKQASVEKLYYELVKV